MTQASIGDICLYAWVSSTVGEPPSKRAVALAFINAFAQSGNIMGSFVWVKDWGPTYNKSFAICITTAIISIFMCLWLRRSLRRLNWEMDLETEIPNGLQTYYIAGWRYHL
jgi:hypothetical protein